MGLLQFITALTFTSQGSETDKNIESVAFLSPITTAYGTAFNSLGLPATVDASFDHGVGEPVTLTWLVGDYDPLVIGTYTLFADIVPGPNMTNDDNVQATIDVEVEELVAPDYSLLANIELILDAQGLVTNTDNTYGVVNATRQLTSWKSLTPGPTDRPFPSNGVAPDVWGKVVYFNGDGRLRHATASVWNFMHYNATIGNLKWTIHAVCEFEDIPGGVFALVGNNGSSQTSKGIAVYFGNNTGGAKKLLSQITKGTTGFIVSGAQADIIEKHSLHVLTVVTDMSLSAADRQKVYIDGVLQTYTVTSPSTAVVTTPTNGLELGAVGNAVLNMVGGVSHFIITSNAAVNTPFIDTLIPHTQRPIKYTVDRSKVYALTVFLDENSYYLNVAVKKNPVTNKYLVVFGNWTAAGHTWNENCLVSFMTSNDLVTFTAKAAAYSPPGTKGSLDVGFFFDPNGVGHGFTNIFDGSGSTPTPGTSQLVYFTTSNDGANWANQIITTPADGLDFIAAYGNGYTVNGFNYFVFYKINDIADFSTSAVYVIKWALGADISTAVFKTVRTGSDQRGEATIFYLGDDSHGIIIRDETTFLWHQYRTDDNFDSIIDDGAIDFGDTSAAVAGPARVLPFDMEGIPCLACYYPLRVSGILNVIYAKRAEVKANGIAGWIEATKLTIVNDTERIHYGDVCQYNGNFNGFGIYTRDDPSVTSNLISFPIPSANYAAVRTTLGITLIT